MNERLFGKLSQIVDGQKRLAAFLGLSPNTVSAWKLRKTSPPSKYIPQIAEFIGVSVEWLLTGNGANNETEGRELPVAFHAPLVEGTIFEYYDPSESGKKIKLTFPPGTSPEEMEAVVSKIVRVVSEIDPASPPRASEPREGVEDTTLQNYGIAKPA